MSTEPGIRVITDPDVLRLIADPLRLRLLELLRQEPRTVKELASLLGIARTRLYYHIKLLEEHDLIAVAETRVVSGITERRYRVTAYRLSVEKSMLGAVVGDDSPLEIYLAIVFDESAAEIRKAIAAGLIDVDQTHEDVIKPRRLVMGRAWFRLTNDELAEFERRFDELRRDFMTNVVFDKEQLEQPPQQREGTLYEFLTGFYPVVPPTGSNDG